MLEKWKITLDIDKVLDVVLMDLSNAFDKINHDLLITVPNGHDFRRDSLLCMFSYLKKEMSKIQY